MQSIIRFITIGGIFLIPAVVFIVSPTMFFPYITGKNFAFRILVEVITVGWLLLALKDAQYRPKQSVILWLFIALLGSMLVSDLMSPASHRSFMSNFERMDGYVTLVHTFLYFLVVSCVIKTKELWRRFFVALIVFATLLSFYGILQATGNAQISQGTAWRIDGTLGNSTYMAVYMLFSMAVAVLYALREKTIWMRNTAVGLAVVFGALIFQTGTRGTAIGLVFGIMVSLAYLAWQGSAYPRLRKIAIGCLCAIVLAGIGFVALKDSSFVQNTPILERLTHISLSEGGTRFTNWGMAWQGVKEKPIFGWGHESFNYVFNKYYDPAMYGVEEWYDRAHNIVFDWLVQGGFVGAILYFGMIVAAFLFLLRRTATGSVASADLVITERALLIGLLVAYVAHNFFVFDNIISYIYFAIIFAYIHQHIAERNLVHEETMGEELWTNIGIPAGIGILAVVIYVVNVPGISVAKGLIDTYKIQDASEKIAQFEKIIARGTFGNQEVREQLMQFVAQQAPAGYDPMVNEKMLAYVASEIQAQMEEKPEDARTNILAGGMYRQIGMAEKAKEQYEIALALTPKKTTLKHELGMTYLTLGDQDTALAYFKDAYEQDTSKMKALMIYATGAVYADRMDLYREIVASEEAYAMAIETDFLYQALYEKKHFNLLQEMYTDRSAKYPDQFELRKNLAIVYYNDGHIKKAIEILEDAIATMQLSESERSGAEGMVDVLQKEMKDGSGAK